MQIAGRPTFKAPGKNLTPLMVTSFDVCEASVAEIHDAMADGDVTATELVDAYLTRIDAYDDELNAILTLNPAAADRAADLDEQFAEDGPVGPLHGIPIVLKDNQDTHDLPTTNGCAALSDSVPERDAFVVQRLREAGGIVLAKANLQEFAYGVDTISSAGGETKNAYDTNRRPSGSSGGTAAAIAANFGTIGTGSDTCSSVRSPPAFNDLVGVRPTRGLVSRAGVVPLCSTQDTVGPITRTVEDAARMLDVLAGYDPADPQTALGAGRGPNEGYVSALSPDGLDGARIGVVREFFDLVDPDAATEAEAESVRAVVDAAIDEMADAGATIVDPIEVVDQEVLGSARVLDFEFARDFADYLDTLPDPPYDSLQEFVDSGTVEPRVEERIRDSDILDTDVESLEENLDYLRSLELRREVRIETERLLVDEELDALCYPPSMVPPVEIPARQPFSELRCELAAHTGLPAITIPAGFTDEGLPVGVELLGREFAEATLFELAAGFEATTDHRRQPDGFGPLSE